MENRTTIHVEGMTCSNCALGVTRLLEKKGLNHVDVNFTTGEVVFEPVENIPQEEIIQGIRSLG